MAALRKAILRRQLTPAEAASLVGKLIHIGDTMQGRIGRAIFAGFVEHSGPDQPWMDEGALHSATFWASVGRMPDAHPSSMTSSQLDRTTSLVLHHLALSRAWVKMRTRA